MESILAKTYIAGADLSDYQYCFVYLSAANTVTFTGAGEAPLGILQNTPELGSPANVMLQGISKLSMSAAAVVMAKIGSAAAGQGVAMTGDDEIYGAICLQAATAADDEIDVLLCPGAPTISAAGDD